MKIPINFSLSTFYVILFFMFFCPSSSISAQALDLFKGETITYSIKKMGVKAGEATLTFQGITKFKEKEMCLIIFTAKALNFFDEEKIYIDPKTFYPLVVSRDLNLWGKKEKIIEEYFSDRGIVKITKDSGGKVTEQEIKKDGKLDNIYSFIYRYRRDGQFRIGDTIAMHLPTKEISVALQEKTKLKAAGQQFDAYYMKSEPSQYQMWFDASATRIPLRINGAVGFGDTSMVMIRYQNN